MRNRFASLSSRLVLVTVGLVALVTLLMALATTLVLHGYLQDQLDQKVQDSLHRAEVGGPFGVAGPPPGATDPDRDGDVRGQQVGTLTVIWYGSQQSSISQLVTTSSTGHVVVRQLTDDQLARLADVPADGTAHTVALSGLGHYRVMALTEGSNAVVAAGLPTSDLDGTISSLVGWEVALVLLAMLAAGATGAVVVRRQLRPLREVAGTAHRVAELPLASEVEVAERVPGHLTDERSEVGQVGHALNTLLSHVETSLAARQRSDQQVRQFVADAAHELRTPLATIAGYTELAHQRPEETGTALDKVESESKRMTALVEDLLLLARLDAGRPLEREPVDLTRLLLESVSDARVLAPDHHWRLDLPDEAVEVTGDEARLHQVVSNLLTNARVYTPAGTTVTVRARPGVIEVHDDGPGFPPELADRAFERFVRADTARSRTGGTGLGLALVEAIVTAHGGSVELETRPGDTTVRVRLRPAPPG